MNMMSDCDVTNNAFPPHITLMTKQRFSSAAATSRLHQKFGNIDTSVATSDILT